MSLFFYNYPFPSFWVRFVFPFQDFIIWSSDAHMDEVIDDINISVFVFSYVT